MNQVASRVLPHMTADEFLLWPGDGSHRRFQLIDGEVWPMSPANRILGVIQARLASLLIGAVDANRSRLEIVTAGAIIPALNAVDNVRVPDLVVAAPGVRGDQIVTEPLLIVEVLSPGNKAATRDNIRAYATLSSVQEILVVSASQMHMELHRRSADGWRPTPEIVEAGGRLALTTIGLDCPIEAVYAGTFLSAEGANPQ